MKTILLALALVTMVTFLPAPAAAQQMASLTIALETPATIHNDETTSAVGIASFTADWTAITGLTGIPVAYEVTQAPTWATVTLSPASDVFPIPSSPGFSPSYTAVRQFTITITPQGDLAEDATGLIEITATTTPTINGKSAQGRGQVPIVFDAPDEPCPDALTHEEMRTWANAAVDAYHEQDAASAKDEAEELSTQSGGATPVSIPTLAIGGFALVGAGVGLLLRRRLSR